MSYCAGSLSNIEQVHFNVNIEHPKGDEYRKGIYMLFENRVLYVSTSQGYFGKASDFSGMFENCVNLKYIYGLENVQTEGVENMSSMFSGCESLEYMNLSEFNTSSVTNMCSMFADCYKLKSLDLSSFDTRNVNNMGYMFQFDYALDIVKLGKKCVINDDCFVEDFLLATSCVFMGKSSQAENFNRMLRPGIEYTSGNVQFAVDMGDAGWWSAWNLGADKPEDFGLYYSWGNDTGHWKNGEDDGYRFTYAEYKTTDGYKKTEWYELPSFSNRPLWLMPSEDDFRSLVSSCTAYVVKQNEVEGVKFVSNSTGNSIFFPDSGRVVEDLLTFSYDYSVYYMAMKGVNTQGQPIDIFCPHLCSYDNMVKFEGVPIRPKLKSVDGYFNK